MQFIEMLQTASESRKDNHLELKKIVQHECDFLTLAIKIYLKKKNPKTTWAYKKYPEIRKIQKNSHTCTIRNKFQNKEKKNIEQKDTGKMESLMVIVNEPKTEKDIRGC